MKLRDIGEEDIRWIWECRNEKVTRLNSINSEVIPYSQHVEWIKQSLVMPTRKIMIAVKEKERIGIVRFDIKDNATAVISIAIAEESRGKGYGLQILELIETKIIKEYPSIRYFKAEIKGSNLISLNLFFKAGFLLDKEKNDIKVLTKAILKVRED